MSPAQEREPAEELTVCVNFTKPMSPAVCAAVVKAVIQHHMFMRELLPVPFEELARQADRIATALAAAAAAAGRAPRRPPPPPQRRLLKAVSALNALFDAVDAVFAAAGRAVREVLVAFGASPQSPREALRLVLPPRAALAAAGGAAAREADARAPEYAAKVVRAMLSTLGAVRLPHLPSASRIHILARVASPAQPAAPQGRWLPPPSLHPPPPPPAPPSGSISALFAKRSSSSSSGAPPAPRAQSAAAFAAAPCACLLPRRGYALPPPRPRRPPHVCLRLGAAAAPPPCAASPAAGARTGSRAEGRTGPTAEAARAEHMGGAAAAAAAEGMWFQVTLPPCVRPAGVKAKSLG